MPKQVKIDQATLDYYMAESQAVHALCDRAAIPQAESGEYLSMSQRVAVMEGVLRELIKNLGKTPPVSLN